MLERSSIESLRSRAEEISYNIASILHRLGYRVPVSKLVDYTRILETYMALKGTDHLSIVEIVLIAESVFTNIEWSSGLREKVYEIISSREHQELVLSQRIISRIRFGKEVRIRDVLNGRLDRSDIETYIVLRKIGVIRKTRDGRLKAIRYRDYKRAIKKLRDYRVTVRDIIDYIDEIPISYWSTILTKEVVDRIGYSDLLKILYGVSKSGSEELKKYVIDRLSRDIEYSLKLGSRDKRVIENLLRSTGYCDLRLALRIYRDLGRDFIDKYGVESIAKEIASLPISERRRILSRISRYLSDNELEYLAGHLGILSFTRIHRSSRLSMTLYSLSNALSSLLDYRLTGEQSYLDYSLYYLDSIDRDYIPARYKPLYESLCSRDYRGLISSLSVIELHSILEYIIDRAIELRERGFDETVLLNALNLGLRILRHIVYRQKGSIYEKRKSIVRRGRLEVRDSLYRIARYNYQLVYTSRVYKPSIIALLDVSGSMRSYSLWAVSTLASIMYRVKIIVLFSDKIEVLRTRGYPLRMLSRFLKSILISKFMGYTDIASAVREAMKYSRRGDIMVLISDLKQTVKGDPVGVVREAISRTSRFIAIVPRNYSIELARAIEGFGGEVVVSKSPLEIPYILRQKLNLKIGIRI